jgi:hypothetical protein
VLVTGERLAIEPRPLPEYSEPLLAAEGLVNTVLRLAKQAAMRRVKVRPSLCEVNSIKYDLELGRIDRRRAPKAWELVDRIQDLRQSWFGGPPDRVRPILRAALEVSLQSLSELDAVVGGPLAPGRKPPGRRLTGPWKNVALVGGSGSGLAVRRVRASTAVSFGGRWKDGSELAWRLVSATLSVPPPVAALLLNGDPSPPYSEFRQERDRTVAAYRSFISRNASGYSMMGVSTMLL